MTPSDSRGDETHDELDALPDPADGTGDGDGPPSGTRGRKGPLLVVGAALAIFVVAALAFRLAEGQGTGDMTAGVVEGRVGSMPTAPEVLWHVPDTSWSVMDGDAIALDAGGGFLVRDVRTGDVTVDHTGAGECRPVRDSTGRVSYPVVMCTASDEQGAAVLTVFSAGGEQQWQQLLPEGSGASLVSVVTSDGQPEDVQPDLLWLVGDAELSHVSRLGGTDGDVRWSVDLELQRADYPSLQVLQSRAMVGAEIAVDLDTGESTRYASPWEVYDEEVYHFEMPVPGGVARATVTPGSTALAVLDEDGAERFVLGEVDLMGWQPVVSEEADLMMIQQGDGTLVAVDTTTGSPRWRPQNQTFMDVVAYLPDVVLLLDGDHMRALAADTGEERWSASVGDGAWSRWVVDESRVIGGTWVDRRASLSAFEAGTGELAWQVDLPSAVEDLDAGDGVLVAQLANGTTVFPTD